MISVIVAEEDRAGRLP